MKCYNESKENNGKSIVMLMNDNFDYRGKIMRKRYIIGIIGCLIVIVASITTIVKNNKIAAKDKVEDKIEDKVVVDTNEFKSSSGIKSDENEVIIEKPAEIAEDSIKYTLPLAQSVQENNYYCVPATLQMAFAHKGIEMTQDELAEELNTSQATGTKHVDLARVLNLYLLDREIVEDNEIGYHVQVINKNESDASAVEEFERRIKTNVDNEEVTFVAVDLKTLYSKYSSINHMVLVNGYVEDINGNITHYYYIDPSELIQDPTYGGLKVVTKEELWKAMVQNAEPAYIW